MERDISDGLNEFEGEVLLSAEMKSFPADIFAFWDCINPE